MGRTLRKRLQRRKYLQEVEPTDHTQLPPLCQQLHALGWRNTTRLGVRDFLYTGRGLCSKRYTFRAGDELMRLPLACMVTVRTLEADADFKEFFQPAHTSAAHKLSFQALMAMYVLLKRHRPGATPLPAYFKTLPSEHTTPYFCTLAELQCLPEAVLEHTVAQNRKVRHNYMALKALAARLHCPCCGRHNFTDLYPLEQFRWAYFVVNTRSVYVDGSAVMASPPSPAPTYLRPLYEDAPNLALAPFLDLFNHTDQVGTATQLERQRDGSLHFVIRLQGLAAPYVSIPRHTQVYISYGQLTNLKLFVEYGFCLPNNMHDVFQFSLLDFEKFLKHDKQPPPSEPHRNKFKFIRDHQLHDQMFVHLQDGMSHNLHVVAHLLFKEPSHHVSTMSQVAFGAPEQLADVDTEIRSMIGYKICEYRAYVSQMQKLPALSRCAEAAIDYMLECVRYLDEYLALN